MGDKFHPLGMGEKSVKISDFMINRKIPRRARKKWPLICLNDEITWVVGYQLAHQARLTDRTTVALVLELEPSNHNN
jgi:tRNA(Ile)-lysidine synthase